MGFSPLMFPVPNGNLQACPRPPPDISADPGTFPEKGPEQPQYLISGIQGEAE